MEQMILKVNNRMTGIPCWLVAFWVNLMIAMLAICPFLLRDNGYFALPCDFTAQQLAFNMFMNDTVKSGNLLWNWGIDIGGNFLESFAFYNVGSVFFWIMLLFPAKMVPRLLGWMIILKFAVAGATSCAYFNRHVKKRVLAVMASMLYAFSSYQTSSVLFFHFQDTVAFFPLMLLALEELVEDKKRGRLIAACVLNVFCNYSFFIGEVIFLIIYYIIKYIVSDIRGGKHGFKTYVFPVANCMVEGAAGMLIGGILLIPAIYGTISNNRVTSHLLGEMWFTITTKNWLILLKAFLIPGEPMNACASVTEADWMSNEAYLPAVGILFVLAYMLSRKDWLTKLLKVCFVIACIPILNSAFMMFMRGEYRRWLYMLVIVMALMTAKVAEAPEEYRIKQALALWTGMFGFYIFMINRVNWNGNGFGTLIYDRKRYYQGLLIAFAGVILVMVVIKWVRLKKSVVLMLVVAFFSVGTFGLNIRYYQIAIDNTNLDFKTYRNSYAENVANYMQEIPCSLDRNVLPYRYYFDEGIGYTYYNLAMVSSLPSINSFISTAHASVTEFYDMLGTGREILTKRGPQGTQELLSARYIVSNVQHPEYTYIQSFENSNGQVMYYYENENALPIGYTYDTYITRSQFESLNPEIRAVAMLATMVVEDEDVDAIGDSLEPYTIDTYGDITAEKLLSYVAMHKEECSESFECGDNYFESVITSTGNKYAFFSVPYDKNWKAKVNGNEVEIMNINGLMAVRVEDGKNLIRFDYVYTPLKIGMACSVFGVLMAVVYLVVFRRNSKKRTDSGIE